MRNFVKTIIVAAAFAVPVLGFAASTKVTVNGMVCAFCAQGIEKKLSKLPMTKAVFVDLKDKVVLVEAKEGMPFDEKEVHDVITSAGYSVVKMEPDSRSVAQMKVEKGIKK